MSDVFGQYVPDFRYEVIRIHNYSNEELLDRGNEMSLIMLLNKLQNPEDFRRFRQSPPDKLADVLRNTDPHIHKLMEDIMYSLMMKMNIPTEEASEYMKAIGGNQMGYLFENMEKMDIQAERRNTAEARKLAEEERQRADAAERRADIEKQRADQAESNRRESEYKSYIAACKDCECSREETAERLARKFQAILADTPQEALKAALKKTGLYWDEA